MKNEICDECGKEMPSLVSLWIKTTFIIWLGSKWLDFCSKECFKNYIKREVLKDNE